MKIFGMCLLVLMGTMRFWADLFQLKKLDAITFALGISPLPIVFSNPEGVEDFANTVHVEFDHFHGRKTKLQFDRNVFGDLPFSPNLRGVYGIGLAYSSHFPEKLWGPALQFGFCKNGDFARAFRQEIPKSVKVLIAHAENEKQKWEHTVQCSQ